MESICNIEWARLYEFITGEYSKKGSRYPRFFKFVLEELGVHSPELDAEVLGLYKTAVGHLELYPDARELLTKLNGKVKLGIVTNGIMEAQANKVRLLGIASYFDHICYARHLGRAHEKPDPMPYSETLAALGVPVSRSVFVGDNPRTDVLGAKRMGMYTVRIRRGEWADTENPEGWLPDMEVRTLEQISTGIELC